MKPEIVTMGQFVASTWPTNIYSYNNGTSMAAPAASGGLALLYQRYRQLNAGVNPKNGLMKALLCNGAADRGNAGPDFKYGYGWMNLLRSVEMMEGTRYFNMSVAQAATNTHTITVPANTAQLKVLLYWNDPAASPLSNKMLVNDLDLQVIDAALATNLPRILDTAVANVNNVATTGVDRLNNIEQVVINNPAAGNYSIKVIGSAIAQNPTQEYFLVYDAVPVQLKITAPAAGEGLVPSSNAFDMMKINWEAYGFLTGTAMLEFSADGGVSWSVIDPSVDINRTIFTWWVPNIATDKALVRITKNGTGETSTSGMFTIAAQPVVTLDAVQCEGYIKMNWTGIAGVTDYEVMMLLDDEMKTVTTTAGNTYTFSGLSKDSVYWVTVRPRVFGKPGKRALAVQRQPATGNCAGNISDGDLKMDAILTPVSGRRFTSTQLSNAAVVSVRIKNIDDAPATNVEVKYSINSGAFISETITATVNASSTYVHTFSTPANLLATGNYLFTFVVKNIGDAVAGNDTLYTVVKHIDNQPLNLSTYFIDDVETGVAATYQKDTVGLAGIERYDFTRSTIFGRARTFVNTGIAFSGSKALTLDADRFLPSGSANFLYGTFNLSNYNAVLNDLRFDFRFLNHGQSQNPVNKVWVRGADNQPWVEAYDLDNNQEDAGLYKKTESIELADIVASAGQLFTGSLQIRWGQWGQLPATEKEAGAGYTFDDIRIYEVVNDVQMKTVDAPLAVSCGLSNATVITVSVRNSSNGTLTNIPVQYRVNNGAWVSATIPSIAGNATVQYSFVTPANLSALGSHNIQAVVNFAADNFKENDTISVAIRNQPVVSTFPYLQNFESGDGYWYASGQRNTWEYGTPASARIKSAASGSKAWKTRLSGHYNDTETSYLHSPCFDITSMTKPTLSFSVALDIEDCGTTLCDAAWVEYSADGVTWSKLGTAASGTNWYNKTTSQVWSTQTYFYWHVASAPLPTGLNSLRLRFAFASDEGVTREGIAIDDIHIYDNTKGIYDGLTMTAPVTQSVSGNSWVDITSGGKLVASIQPSNQSLGNTAVQAFILDSALRYNNSQYYHQRNITIKPTNAITDSVAVRFYFLDKETDTLLRATGCITCGKPASAYDLGVSKYSDPDKSFENGTVLDNQQGLWQFISKENVAIVPFDKGYYAEFKVKDFSEFWLNNGGFTGTTPLPVKMMDFAAQKTGASEVLLTWKVGSETDVLRYEIEVAKGNDALQAGQFIKAGEVLSAGNTTTIRNYSFTDAEPNKTGARFYRLKIINANGAPVYSPIRSVVFDDVVLWQVYPNPSKGQFFLQYQVGNNEQMEARVYDSKGSLIKMEKAMGTGFQQKLVIDLSKGIYATGVYLLKIQSAGVQRSFKLFKQ
ncbi:MAG: S8 family serine peptidase [Bacteroidota bacterium]